MNDPEPLLSDDRFRAAAEALRSAAEGRVPRAARTAMQDAATLLDDARAAVGMIRERHTAMTVEAEFYCGDEDAFPEDAEGCPPRPGASYPDDCPGHIIAVEVCQDCGHDHDDGYPIYLSYPCPTIRHLEGAL